MILAGDGPAYLLGMLRCALVLRLKPEDIEAIADVLIMKATTGDVAAAKLVLSYGIGTPTEAGIISHLTASLQTLGLTRSVHPLTLTQ
jgi:hypothetical protein